MDSLKHPHPLNGQNLLLKTLQKLFVDAPLYLEIALSQKSFKPEMAHFDCKISHKTENYS